MDRILRLPELMPGQREIPIENDGERLASYPFYRSAVPGSPERAFLAYSDLIYQNGANASIFKMLESGKLSSEEVFVRLESEEDIKKGLVSGLYKLGDRNHAYATDVLVLSKGDGGGGGSRVQKAA